MVASVQVGAFCYADAAAAAVAACASYPFAMGAASGGLSSVECVGVNVDNSLSIKSGFQSLPCTGSGCAWIYATSSVAPSYPACWHGDVVDAGMVLLGVLLGVWAPCYGLYRLYKMLMFTRGSSD